STIRRIEFSGTTYTIGAKVSPARWLMLRSSYATGEQPPVDFTTMVETDLTTTIPFALDPQRGGALLGADGPYLVKFGSRADLKMVRASTMFLGAVLTPRGVDGPRLAVDYSHIRRTRDAILYLPDDILAHEDYWPDRIERGSLTDADRALGYTAGPI